jgi:molybdenum cofactor synthesis domain-containing protein
MKQMVGVLKYICRSEKKGTVKSVIPVGELREDYGLVGDAHAGAGHRQISLLDEADIDGMRVQGLKLQPGAFGENLVVEGLNLGGLGIGSQLRVGEALLELTQIGKVCHTRCAIYHETGDCIMPRTGLFATVLAGGEVQPGMAIETVKEVPRERIQAGVITVSDRCTAGVTRDTAGPAVAELLTAELGAHISWAGIVPDEFDRIVETLKDLGERGLDLAVTVGGTGCAPRDVTPEATRAVIEREAPGLSEAMRRESAKINNHALLQRGVCGIYQSCLIINLPGSAKGAVENLAAVVEVLPHAVKQLRGVSVHNEEPGRVTKGDSGLSK